MAIISLVVCSFVAQYSLFLYNFVASCNPVQGCMSMCNQCLPSKEVHASFGPFFVAERYSNLSGFVRRAMLRNTMGDKYE